LKSEVFVINPIYNPHSFIKENSLGLDSSIKSLQKQFTKNILLLIGINLLIKPLYVLAIDAQVQNRVGDEAYGMYFALFNFCFLFQIILDMGIQNYNSKEVAQNRAAVAEQFALVFGTKLMLITLFLVAISVGAAVIGYGLPFYKLLLGIGAIMTLQSMLVYLRSHFSALGYFATDSWLSGLEKLLMIFILGYFIYVTQEITIAKFIYGQIAGIGIAILFTIVWLGKKFSLAARFSITDAGRLLHKSFPYALIFILMTLYTRMDSVMLERLLDDNAKAAGVYATGYRLMDAANILGYLFAMLLLPMFAHKLAKGQDVNHLVRAATGMLLTCATIGSMTAWFYAEDFMKAIYTDITVDNIEVFRSLMISFWFVSMSYIFGALITASGDIKKLNVLFLFGIVINLGLNLILIPQRGALGAATATLATQSFVFLGQFLLAKTKFTLRYPATYISKAIIFMLFSFVLLYIFSQKLTILWILEVLLAVSILLGVSILFGFFRFNVINENED